MNINTERLNIRPFINSDIDDIFEIYSDKNICKFLLHEPWTLENKEIEFSKKLLANKLTIDSPISLACVLNNKIIGEISIFYTEMKETVELGIAFNSKYSGRGYATEALIAIIDYLFNIKKVHRIQANLDARNIFSAKLCERVGMRKEAHFIKDYWNKGEWTDSFIYGILLEDIG